MSDGVTILLTLDIKPEFVDAFCEGLPAMLKDTATRPGFRNIRVVRAGNKLTFVELWDSEATYDDYLAWRAARGDMESLGSMLNGMDKTVWPTLVASA